MHRRECAEAAPRAPRLCQGCAECAEAGTECAECAEDRSRCMHTSFQVGWRRGMRRDALDRYMLL